MILHVKAAVLCVEDAATYVQQTVGFGSVHQFRASFTLVAIP